MVATDERRRPPAAATALEGLMAAALLLPGVTCTPAQAQDQAEVALQVAQHRDAARRVDGVPAALPALRVDSVSLQSTSPLSGGWQLRLGYAQDTWSGATPIATAPASAGGNRPVLRGNAGQLVVAGASPMITGRVLLDAQDRVVAPDGSGALQAAPALVHTMSSASPETRQQLNLALTRRLGGGTATVAGGVSQEHDFRSRFVRLERRVDDGADSWTLALGATRSDSAAVLDHDAAPYITKTAYAAQIDNRNGQQVLSGHRDEWTATLGLTRALTPSVLWQATASLNRSHGDLANPYKVTSVIFAPPASEASAARGGDLQALLEQRPQRRQQWSLGHKLVLHHAPLDAALHLSLGASGDDWGVRTHRLEGEWFQPINEQALLSLRLRYHTQTAASFYRPYLVSHQAYRQVSVGADGQVQITRFDPTALPAHFASDQRLAGFGVLGVGIGWTQRMGGGATLDLSLDHATQSGRLKWAGGGQGRYADTRYLLAQASLSLAFGNAGPRADHPAALGHGPHRHDAPLPAEVMLAHAPPDPGEVMIGYRQQGQRRALPLRSAAEATPSCGGQPCAAQATAMAMRMQMLDLMVGLGEQWSLMLMPQFMNMAMHSERLPGSEPVDAALHLGRHESAGLGDTQLHLLRRLGTIGSGASPVLGLGLSVPTGRTSMTHRRAHQQDGAALDYGMQTGTGTWDLLPSVTHLDQAGPWSWGAQLSAAVRLQSINKAGYAWGPRWQATTWAGYRWSRHLAASARAAWRAEPGVVGARTSAAPGAMAADFAANQGARVAEIGAGLSWTTVVGALSLEALQPVYSRMRGDQLAPRQRWALAWQHAH